MSGEASATDASSNFLESGPTLAVGLCLVFALTYYVTAMFAFTQLVRLNGRGAPWTTQKVLHVLVVLAASVRGVFFCVAIRAWNWSDGDLSGAEPIERMAFYVCDELPTLVFFTVYTAVTLFWAEMYYIASDSARVYEETVQPIDSVINTGAYVFLVSVWFLYATWWASYELYAHEAYAYVVAALYVGTAVLLFAFGRSAQKELHQVPIELQMRRKKLREVSVMTSTITTSMLCRAGALVMLAGKRVPLNNETSLLAAAVYFALLELLPVVLVLFYYRRMPQPANRKLLAEEQGMLFSARPPSNKNVNAHQGAEDAIRRLSELRFEASEL